MPAWPPIADGRRADAVAALRSGACRPYAAKPLPYTDALVERGRALAAFGRDPHRPDVAQALENARRRARKLGWISALPVLDAALVTIAGEARSSPGSP